MARRRRPTARTSIVDGRARIVVPIETITTADDQPARFADLSRWLPLVRSSSAPLDAVEESSIAVDGFAFDLYIGDLAFATGVHDGSAFTDAVRTHGEIDVHVSVGLDPVRSSAADLDDAATRRELRGGRLAAFVVDRVSD